jgi:GAF domain/Bacterial regulatory protein, Fis family
MSRVLMEDLIAPFGGALARVWRLRPGDLCASCLMRPECRDRTTCLHLVSSAGLSTRLDGPFRRFPIGARALGKVMSSAAPYVVNDRLDALEVADPAWIGLHGIRSFAAFALRREGAGIGVFALFARRALDPEDVRGLAAVAELLALTLPAGERAAPRPLRDVERDAIERALVQTGGRVSGPRGAARMLGLKPTTLQSRMKKLGVRRPPRS